MQIRFKCNEEKKIPLLIGKWDLADLLIRMITTAAETTGSTTNIKMKTLLSSDPVILL